MILEKGNMWSIFETTNNFVITTNPIIKQNGEVVMGAGIAKQARDKFFYLAHDFGLVLERDGYSNVGYINKYNGTNIWWFMVKNHWGSNAQLDIIQDSTTELAYIARHSADRFDLNFPGIGNGKLQRDLVLPYLRPLPDNVHVWEYE